MFLKILLRIKLLSKRVPCIHTVIVCFSFGTGFFVPVLSEACAESRGIKGLEGSLPVLPVRRSLGQDGSPVEGTKDFLCKQPVSVHKIVIVLNQSLFFIFIIFLFTIVLEIKGLYLYILFITYNIKFYYFFATAPK